MAAPLLLLSFFSPSPVPWHFPAWLDMLLQQAMTLFWDDNKMWEPKSRNLGEDKLLTGQNSFHLLPSPDNIAGDGRLDRAPEAFPGGTIPN